MACKEFWVTFFYVRVLSLNAEAQRREESHGNRATLGIPNDNIGYQGLFNQKLPTRTTDETGGKETSMLCAVAVKQTNRAGRDAAGQRNVEAQQTFEWRCAHDA